LVRSSVYLHTNRTRNGFDLSELYNKAGLLLGFLPTTFELSRLQPEMLLLMHYSILAWLKLMGTTVFLRRIRFSESKTGFSLVSLVNKSSYTHGCRVHTWH